MANNGYTNIDKALHRLDRDSLIDHFHRERISDEAMYRIVLEPESLEFLAPVVSDPETRERILATYTYIKGRRSLGKGVGKARERIHPSASRPARSSEESRAQVARVRANLIPRFMGA